MMNPFLVEPMPDGHRAMSNPPLFSPVDGAPKPLPGPVATSPSVQKLQQLREHLVEIGQWWDWEVERAESDRIAGNDQPFLIAKTGRKATATALTLCDTLLGDVTGWPQFSGDASYLSDKSSETSAVSHADNKDGHSTADTPADAEG